MLPDNASCRLLQEVNHGKEFLQFPSYSHSEVVQIQRELTWRYEELKSILNRQRKTLTKIIQYPEVAEQSSATALTTIVEFPHFALWVHVSAIQQLQRALNIYKYQRMQWMSQIVFRNFITGTSISDHMLTRLSSNEIGLIRRLTTIIEKYGTALINTMTHRDMNESLVARRLIDVAQAALNIPKVILPDPVFRARMKRLSQLDNRPGVSQWTFENPLLPAPPLRNMNNEDNKENDDDDE